ncbi:hypothetical protein BYT27DRAFT_7208432 [Phlegmacium glaucopus]|nr:hypothetical protein BYT27DRAFT_7208432 [Phlegmacium glaucopus]
MGWLKAGLQRSVLTELVASWLEGVRDLQSILADSILLLLFYLTSLYGTARTTLVWSTGRAEPEDELESYMDAGLKVSMRAVKFAFTTVDQVVLDQLFFLWKVATVKWGAAYRVRRPSLVGIATANTVDFNWHELDILSLFLAVRFVFVYVRLGLSWREEGAGHVHELEDQTELKAQHFPELTQDGGREH